MYELNKYNQSSISVDLINLLIIYFYLLIYIRYEISVTDNSFLNNYGYETVFKLHYVYFFFFNTEIISFQEEGEVLVGQVLTYGASIRSGLFMKAPTELQQEILKLLLERAKEKSYLPLLVYTFIFEYMDKVSIF